MESAERLGLPGSLAPTNSADNTGLDPTALPQQQPTAISHSRHHHHHHYSACTISA